MKMRLSVLALSLVIPNLALASEAGNILACINAVQAYTGKTVDEFDVNYTRKILGFDSAEWTGIKCEAAFDTVQNLTVDGKEYVIDGFAGRSAKLTYEEISKETERSVSLLYSRIKLLEKRLKQSEGRLKQPNPNLDEIRDFIATGISKATGK